MIEELCILIVGLYIGKFYPQYVPLPHITKAHTDRLLKYLEDLQKKENPPA
jgi:hypothetical protein